MSTISESQHATKLEPRPTDIIVAVMGMTGSGKSTFISHCMGVDLGIVGHGLQGYTQAVDCYMFRHSESVNVYLVDTPGFDDTNLTDSDVLKAIGTWMGDTYSKDIKLNGIIYLHRITDPRMVGSAKKNLIIFKKLCGQDALKNVTLATTMWEAVPQSDGERREHELLETPEFWGYMRSKGAKVERHYNNRDSAMQILSEFFTEEQVVTAMQEELVNGKKKLSDTEAGMELNSEYRKLEEKLARQLQDRMDELEEAQKKKDYESTAFLKECRKQLNDQLAQVSQQREELNVTLAKMLATSTFPIVRAPGSFDDKARRLSNTGNAGQAEAGRLLNPYLDPRASGVCQGVEVPARGRSPGPPYQPDEQPIHKGISRTH
ncbi:P-loop containing nucleoside triphosphate hydrolase protein [Neurospora crassa]|nr:P-loop containing nucleoside triphosphate hydrolase protein [Neurospora crassa]